MENERCLKIWTFDTAPEELKKLSTHGGNEDWLLFAPKPNPSDPLEFPYPLADVINEYEEEQSYVQGYGHVDRHELKDGSIVVIFAHS